VRVIERSGLRNRTFLVKVFWRWLGDIETLDLFD